MRCLFHACTAPVAYQVIEHRRAKGDTVRHCCEAHRPGVRAGAPSGVAYRNEWYTVTPITAVGEQSQ